MNLRSVFGSGFPRWAAVAALFAQAVCLPAALRRNALTTKAAAEGVTISDALLAQLHTLAGGSAQ